VYMTWAGTIWLSIPVGGNLLWKRFGVVRSAGADSVNMKID